MHCEGLWLLSIALVPWNLQGIGIVMGGGLREISFRFQVLLDSFSSQFSL